MPLVSIVISAKDSEKTLEKTLKSAFGSNYSDFEVVLVDDGSQDRTHAIACSLQERFANLRIIQNQKNLGLARSLNMAIASCDSKYIARLDADDLVTPNRLQVQATFLEEHAKIDICGSGAVIIDEHDKAIGVSPPKAFTPTLLWASLWRVPFFHPSVCIRRELFDADDIAYDESDALGFEDYKIWSRILQRSDGHNFTAPLIFYRKHNGQVTAQKTIERQEAYSAVCQTKISAHTGIEMSKAEAALQWYYAIGSFKSVLGQPQALRQAVEMRQSCAEALIEQGYAQKRIMIGFGADLSMAMRAQSDAHFNRWLLACSFRRSCLGQSLKLLPSYTYFKLRRRGWMSNPVVA